jgi:four helix bundle protein
VEAGFRGLIVYQKALDLSIAIFKVTKKFPKEETYSLIDQIRRSSRSVCSNIGEAYRKRQFIAHFKNKLSDADMENTETQVWLDLSLESDYINKSDYHNLNGKSVEIGKLLYYMMTNPDKFQIKK